MFNTAYDTTACKDYVLSKTILDIQKQRIVNHNGFMNVAVGGSRNNPNGRVLNHGVQIGPSIIDIPNFAHPLLVPGDKHGSSGDQIFVDVRNFTRVGREVEFTIASPMDYELMILRCWTQVVWTFNGRNEFHSLGSFPLVVYSRWVTEAITKRLALTPDVQMRLSIITAYFYLCMHEVVDVKLEKFEEPMLMGMSQKIARATYVNVEEVIQIIDQLPVFRGIADLCFYLAKESGTIRMENMNIALLYGMVSGSWFGQNHRETVAVALEHPPTFVAMLAKAHTERGFHNTIISKIAKLADRGDIAETFIRNLTAFPTDS